MSTRPYPGSGPVSSNARSWPQLPGRERQPSPPAGQPGKQQNYSTGRLSFRRIIDISFETCIAALESWHLTGHDSELHVGQSLLRGPIQHDLCSDTYRIEVQLARGPLRPTTQMRLDIDRWSSPPPRTALELIPCGRARPTATYFRAGHLLLDSLTRSLTRHQPAERSDDAPDNRPQLHHGAPQPKPSRLKLPTGADRLRRPQALEKAETAPQGESGDLGNPIRGY